ncbi:MAG: response regulator, partial [Bacteroidales bacterium]|nr:response regulator [Bacteroidales bacterium]
MHYACNGKEGLEKALQIVPDVIITDIMMPEMNGIEM